MTLDLRFFQILYHIHCKKYKHFRKSVEINMPQKSCIAIFKRMKFILIEINYFRKIKTSSHKLQIK